MVKNVLYVEEEGQWLDLRAVLGIAGVHSVVPKTINRQIFGDLNIIYEHDYGKILGEVSAGEEKYDLMIIEPSDPEFSASGRELENPTINLIRKVKAQGTGVIIATGYRDETYYNMVWGLQQGRDYDSFYQKPVDVERLRRDITSRLEVGGKNVQ